MSAPTLLVATTTANFLPATAWFDSALRNVHRWSRAEGFAPPELLTTRAVVRRPPLDLDWLSVHEVWNPRDRLWHELQRIARRQPQSRGMTPHPVDSLMFADGGNSERVQFAIAEKQGGVAVVSELQSPITGLRYASATACVQVHPDLGPAGAYLDLESVAARVEAGGYGVVLDTNHVRRRVRQHPKGWTEISPPLPGPGDASLGGVKAVWQRLGARVRLVHFQFSEPEEYAAALANETLPRSLDEFREILPELAARRIPVVIEINAGWVATSGPERYGLAWGAMRDATRRIRDLLARAAAQ